MQLLSEGYKLDMFKEVTILVFLAALVQRNHHDDQIQLSDLVTILVFLAALVQLKKRGSEQWTIYPRLQSLFFWQL